MNNKTVIRVMYIFLVIAIVVVVVCGVMVVKNTKNKESQENHGLSVEELSDSQSESSEISSEESTQAGMGFDSYVSGSKQIKEIAMKIKEVPVIVYFQDTFDKKPLVLVQHGITSKKEDVSYLAQYFTKAGYVVVTPDAAGHGELESTNELTLAELIAQTGENFDTIISYFEESMYVEIERTGVVGFSLGGLAAFHYTANGVHQPKVMVSICSTPDFEDLANSSVGDIVYANGKEKKVRDKKKCAQMIESLTLESPYEKLTNNTQTSFYLLCGDKDETVPYEGNLRFYEDMNGKAKDIVLKVKENQKHEVKEEDLEEIYQYLKGHL